MRASDRPYLPKTDQPALHGQSLPDADWRGCIARATGLELPESMAEPAWQDVGTTLVKARSATKWWVGDWWAFAEHRYGDREALLMADDWNGPALQTCANAAVVCRAFETYRRREVLSFAHHAEVASLPADKADSLLDWCEEAIGALGRARSVRALREERQRREYQQCDSVVMASEAAKAVSYRVNVAAIHAEREPEPTAGKTVTARLLDTLAVNPAPSWTHPAGLSGFMYCMTQLGAYDGARVGALVARERRGEFLYAARAARHQLDALIQALGA